MLDTGSRNLDNADNMPTINENLGDSRNRRASMLFSIGTMEKEIPHVHVLKVVLGLFDSDKEHEAEEKSLDSAEGSSFSHPSFSALRKDSRKNSVEGNVFSFLEFRPKTFASIRRNCLVPPAEIAKSLNAGVFV